MSSSQSVVPGLVSKYKFSGPSQTYCLRNLEGGVQILIVGTRSLAILEAACYSLRIASLNIGVNTSGLQLRVILGNC